MTSFFFFENRRTYSACHARVNICMANVQQRQESTENVRGFLKWRCPSLFLECLSATTLPFFSAVICPRRYRQTVMCTMSHPYTFIPLSLICIVDEATRQGNSTCSYSVCLGGLETVRCWTPSRWLPHSLPYPTPPFSTPLPLFLLPIPLLFAFVGIIPCYIHTLALALSCLSKTVTQSTMSVSVFSISSLLWSNITVDMVDWYQPNLSVSICVPSNMVHNLTQTWGEMLLFSIVQSRRWRRTWATPNKQYKTFSCQFAFYANVIEAFRMLPYKKWKA